MTNEIQNTLNELNDWWDICSIKAEYEMKVDIYDIMAMLHCLNELDLLRATESEMEM